MFITGNIVCVKGDRVARGEWSREGRGNARLSGTRLRPFRVVGRADVVDVRVPGGARRPAVDRHDLPGCHARPDGHSHRGRYGAVSRVEPVRGRLGGPKKWQSVPLSLRIGDASGKGTISSRARSTRTGGSSSVVTGDLVYRMVRDTAPPEVRLLFAGIRKEGDKKDVYALLTKSMRRGGIG